MQKKFSRIKIGQSGAIEINIPLVKILGRTRGSKALILCGMHGDEYTGLLIINKVLEQIKEISGELWIIPSANPLAHALGSRVTPIDGYDLNRKFPGDRNKELTDRIASAIFGIAKKMDVVLDFHTFSDPTVITSIFMNCGSRKTRNRTLNFVKIFNPDIVWQMNVQSKNELKFVTALGPKISFEGVPNIAIELPQHYEITPEQIRRAVDGTIRVLNEAKITNMKLERNKRTPIFVEHSEIDSDISGIFISKKSLMEKVKKGDVIGSIIDINTFKKSRVTAHESGVLMVLKNNQFVSTGDRIFTIGKMIKEKD